MGGTRDFERDGGSCPNAWCSGVWATAVAGVAGLISLALRGG